MKKTICFVILLVGMFHPLVINAQVDSVYYRAARWQETMKMFAEQDAKNTMSSEKLVLFIGSSSFTRWDNIENYFPQSNVLNRGFGGSITTDLLYYFDQIVLPYKPSQIVIYEGDNDIVMGMSSEDYLTDVKSLVRQIEVKLPGVPMLILSTKSCPKRDKYRKVYEEANAKMYAYAMSKPMLTYVDVYSLLLNEKGEYRIELFADDMLHINAKAYQLWADRIRPHILQKK